MISYSICFVFLISCASSKKKDSQFESLCARDKIWPNNPKIYNPALNCRCKPHAVFKSMCYDKIELLHREPLVAIFHNYIGRVEINWLMNSSVSKQTFMKPVYTNKYGFTWHSKDFSHTQALLDGRDAAARFLYEKAAKTFHIKLPNNHCPTMNMAKYQKGSSLKVTVFFTNILMTIKIKPKFLGSSRWLWCSYNKLDLVPKFHPAYPGHRIDF